MVGASVDGINEANRYDSFGNRVAIINSLGVEASHALDVSRSLVEVIDEYTRDHDVISSNVDGFGPISRRANGVTEYLLSDRMGSTRVIVDASGVPIGTAAYSASGQLLASTVR